MSSDSEMGNKCLNHRVAATKRILQRREIKMLKSFTTKSDQDKPLAEVEDDKGNREADVEGLAPVVLEARYRKRMVRIIAK